MPDVAGILDKTMGDKNQLQELSPSAYSRFRRALGKLLWMAQSRHDLKLYLSLIGSQQARPNQGTEAAIRSLLRFLFEDVGTCLRLPSPEYENLMIGPARHSILHSFSDASFAPYRFNGRKGFLVESRFVKVHWLGHWLDNSSLCRCPLAKQNCMHCKWLPKNQLRLAIFAIVCT